MSFFLLLFLFIFQISAGATDLAEVCTDDNTLEVKSLSYSDEVIQSYIQKKGYGIANFSIQTDDDETTFYRIRYPIFSRDPGSYYQKLAPLGGVGTQLPTAPLNKDCLWLSYDIRIPVGFNWVKGGKLPGLAGGTANTGGNIPNGTDGFSARLMWRPEGKGEVYAYLPDSESWGSSFGYWQFLTGQWFHIKELVKLNTPGSSNGIIRLWFNDKLMIDKSNLRFRDTNSFNISVFYLETFFGGHDPDWATPVDTHIDFRNFKIALLNNYLSE